MANGQPSSATALKRKARRKARTLPVVGAVAVLVGAAWWGWMKTHPAEDPNAKLITAKVSRGDLTETVSATGNVTGQTGELVKIGSQITGRIKRLYADVGSQVKAGQVIAELDLPDIKAQLDQAESTLAQARTRLLQQQSGYDLQKTQSATGVAQAQENLNSGQAKLQSALASANLQNTQTPTDIRRAETALSVTRAALSTAQATLKQTQASANLQIGTAQEQLRQAQANADNSAINLKRQQDLLAKGFVAQSVVDTAEATDKVNQSQVAAAQQNVQLVREKVTADVQTARDQVTQAEQNIAAAQAALEAARAETNQNVVRSSDVNDARAQVKQLQAALRSAQSATVNVLLKQQDIQQAQEAVRVAQAQVDYAHAQYDKTFIRSPITGTVLQLAAQQGETLAAGLSAPTLIVVANLNALQVDVYVDETDIGKIRLGQEADVKVDAFPKKTFRGNVTKIASGSTIQQGVVTYDVTVAITDKKHQLKPDMTASVTVQTGKQTNVLLVPAEAVKIGSRGSTVNVQVMKDGKPSIEQRKIKTGASDGVNTEVLDGLKEGDTVVLAGMTDSKRQGGGPSSPFGPSGGRGGGGGRR